MIAKSDLLILTLASGALAAGIYRWQENAAVLSPSAAPAVEVVAVAPAPSAGGPALVPSTDAGAGNGTAERTSPVVRRISAANAAVDAPERPVAVSARVAPRAATAPTAGAAVADRGDGGEPLYGVYRVRSGDYLGMIAERFGTTVRTLREINDIEGSLIKIDQEIHYPLPAN